MKCLLRKLPISSRTDYTTFEACGQLFQFKQIAFGVRNGDALQRVINGILRTENLKNY